MRAGQLLLHQFPSLLPVAPPILTGAYSHLNGVRTLEDSFDRNQDNIAKQMQAGGYQTALFGKWHLKTQPSGFDTFSVFHDQGEYINPVFKTAENWKDDTEGRYGTEEKGLLHRLGDRQMYPMDGRTQHR